MKVYLDKLPKNCFECPCFVNDIDFPCGLSDGTKDYYLDEIDGGECPLQSLSEHDKQLRKEMAEAIVSLAKENESLKNELIKECQEHRQAMQIADKRIKELEKQLKDLQENEKVSSNNETFDGAKVCSFVDLLNEEMEDLQRELKGE